MMSHGSQSLWSHGAIGHAAGSTRRMAEIPGVQMHDRQVPGLMQSVIIIVVCSLLFIGMAFGICDRLVDVALTHLWH